MARLTDTLRLRTQCRTCGLPYRVEIRQRDGHVVCPGCGHASAVDDDGWRAGGEPRVDRCLLCGCRHLYRQRGVDRAAGCALVAIAAVLAPFTWGLTLVLALVLDRWAFRRLPEAVVCYRCDTVYRDARPGPGQREFDLLLHDIVKYGKSWEPQDREPPRVEDS